MEKSQDPFEKLLANKYAKTRSKSNFDLNSHMRRDLANFNKTTEVPLNPDEHKRNPEHSKRFLRAMHDNEPRYATTHQDICIGELGSDPIEPRLTEAAKETATRAKAKARFMSKGYCNSEAQGERTNQRIISDRHKLDSETRKRVDIFDIYKTQYTNEDVKNGVVQGTRVFGELRDQVAQQGDETMHYNVSKKNDSRAVKEDYYSSKSSFKTHHDGNVKNKHASAKSRGFKHECIQKSVNDMVDATQRLNESKKSLKIQRTLNESNTAYLSKIINSEHTQSHGRHAINSARQVRNANNNDYTKVVGLGSATTKFGTTTNNATHRQKNDICDRTFIHRSTDVALNNARVAGMEIHSVKSGDIPKFNTPHVWSETTHSWVPQIDNRITRTKHIVNTVTSMGLSHSEMTTMLKAQVENLTPTAQKIIYSNMNPVKVIDTLAEWAKSHDTSNGKGFSTKALNGINDYSVTEHSTELKKHLVRDKFNGIKYQSEFNGLQYDTDIDPSNPGASDLATTKGGARYSLGKRATPSNIDRGSKNGGNLNTGFNDSLSLF